MHLTRNGVYGFPRVMGDEKDYPSWTAVDVAIWKLWPHKLGGGISYIQRYKDGWVKFNRANIKRAADDHRVPPELLGAVAWIEVGGDPQFIDRIAYDVRVFDWSGPGWVDDHFTMTRHPYKTSFGPVSIQLRRAAETMRLDLDQISSAQRDLLVRNLETDAFNLDVVAGHLQALILTDFPDADTAHLTEEQIRIAGTRYNRGPDLELAAIKKNTRHGNFILKIWPRVSALLQAGASGSW